MIDQKDFIPKTLGAQWFKGIQVDSFDAAVAAASDWIEQEGIDVINIETVVLPIGADDKTEESLIIVASDTRYSLRQFIRVWYRKLP